MDKGVKIEPGKSVDLTVEPTGNIELTPGKLVGDPRIQISKVANATDPARAWLRWFRDDTWYSQYPQQESKSDDPDDVYNDLHSPPANDDDNPWRPVVDDSVSVPDPDPNRDEYGVIEGRDGTASITVSDDTATNTNHRICSIYYDQGHSRGDVLASVRLTSPTPEVLSIDPAPEDASDPWYCRLSVFDANDSDSLSVS